MPVTPLMPLFGIAAPAALKLASGAVAEGMEFAQYLADKALDVASPDSKPTESAAAALPQHQIDIAALRSNAEQQLAALEQRLREMLAAQGINLSAPVEIKSDGQDGLVEAGHPQRALIEQMLARDPQLAEDFHALARQQQLVRSLEEGRPARGDFVLRLDAYSAAVDFE